MRNYGQHNALLCGIRRAPHELTVTLDDDLQHPPEEIPKVLERLGPDVDVVYGTPAVEQHGLWRDIATQVTKFALQSAMGALDRAQGGGLQGVPDPAPGRVRDLRRALRERRRAAHLGDHPLRRSQGPPRAARGREPRTTPSESSSCTRSTCSPGSAPGRCGWRA